MSLLYSLLVLAACLLAAPYFLIRALVRPGWRRGLGERFGRLPASLLRDRRPTIWVHAVSVGEVRAARGILQGLVREHPEHRVVLSVTTPSGREVAESAQLPVDGIFHLPLDLPRVPGKVLDALDCRMFITMETEIWPNLILDCHRLGIPALILNGRISDASFRYYRPLRFFLKKTLRRLAFAGMQTWEDAERLTWMGMPVHRMEVTGSVKFDLQVRSLEGDHPVARLLEGHTGPVWIAASTWPGEEEAVLTAARRLWEDHPSLLVVLAPRKPDRFDEVAGLLEARGLPHLRRSRMAEAEADPGAARVLLLDSLGELEGVYRYGDLAFVGGSLASIGGHNLIEPAAWGLPVLFGPNVQNFRRVARQLQAGGGAAMVLEGSDLEREVRRLLEDDDLRREIGERARAVVERNRGAVAKSLRIVRHFLKEEGPGPRRLLPVHQEPHHGTLPPEQDGREDRDRRAAAESESP